MLRWLPSLFSRPKPGHATAPPAPPGLPAGPARRPAEPAPAPGRPEAGEPPAAAEFLVALVGEAEPADLQALGADDRVFLSGILKRIRENQLEIPLLPQAALEISRLLGNPNSHMDEFVRVLEGDPALSVDVLRIANSAFYGFAAITQSVHNAVRRIGLNQIRGLIVVAHLHGKVLQGSGFHAEAGLLMELSLALAQLGHDAADWLGLDPDAAYTRGVLSHVEHFVIMGAAAEVSKDHQRRIAPTREGLLEAFRRCGPTVRELAARAWKLEGVMLDEGPDGALRQRLGQLERAFVAAWTGQEIPGATAPEGLAPGRVSAAVQRLRGAAPAS